MASRFEATAGSAIGPVAGGTVEQAVNKLTDVTLNAEAGMISMSPVDGTTTGVFRFTVFNDRVSASDLVLTNFAFLPSASNPEGKAMYQFILQVVDVREGRFDVFLKQLVSGNFQPFIYFCIFKGSST